MDVLIYNLASVSRRSKWVIEPRLLFPRDCSKFPYYSKAFDTRTELYNRLIFNTLDDAVSFARLNNWSASFHFPSKNSFEPKNYLQNFNPKLINAY
ncbi:MAG: hypothetical protein FWE93_05115 [Alphaproteobacteria bacterium]|nr:hypothetical protein [Alphaproteobacteria bacterium]